MNITLPDGTVLKDVPDGTTKAQVREKLAANGYDVSKLDAPVAAPPDPVERKRGFLENAVRNATQVPIGVGEAAANMVTGAVAKPVSELAGLGGVLAGITGLRKDADPEAEKRAVAEAMTYQPKTDMGKTVAEYNPLALAGKAIGGLAQGAGEATASMIDNPTAADVARNVVPEAITGGLGILGARGMGPTVVKPKLHTTDIVKNKAIDAGTQLGLRASPLERGGSRTTRQAEDIAGSTRVQHDLAVDNRPTINAKVREQLRLPKEAPLTNETYKQAIAREYGPYVEAKGLGQIDIAKAGKPSKIKDAAEVVETIKQLRSDGHAYAKSAARSADPAALARSKKLLKKADRLDGVLDDAATVAGRPDLVPALKQARANIAQVYSAKTATKGGDIVAAKLTNQLEKGVPISGNMKTIAEFQQQAEGSMRRPKAGSSPLETPSIITAIPRYIAKLVSHRSAVNASLPGKRSLARTPASAAAIAEALRNKEQDNATQ